MASKTAVLIAFAVFLVSAFAALGTAARDPELEICRQRCRIQTVVDPSQKQSCYSKCLTYSREREERREREEGQGQEERGEDSPFVFRPRHFLTAHSSDRGRLSILQRFSERSNLFQNIEPFRLGVLEVEPKTFALPNHIDADLICFIANGKGILNIIQENKRRIFNVTEGELVVIPAGATTYLINPDSDRKLVVVKLIRTISSPGRFEYFFGSMFLNAFSSSIREAAYNDANKETLDRVLMRGQDQDPFLEISDQQLRSIVRQEEQDDVIGWPFLAAADKSSKRRTVNIFQHKTISNKYGELYEVGNDELDNIQISFANVTEGGMFGPLFNTRGVKLMFVVEGEGSMEMAVASSKPDSGSSEKGSTGTTPSFERISARLFPGTVIVNPAGHPYVNVAERRSLKLLCFHINARNNEKVPLAGKNNVFMKFDRIAEDIAFGGSRKDVEQVFGSNSDNELFFKAPREERRAVE